MKRKLMMFFVSLFVLGIGVITSQTSSVSGVVISEEDGMPVLGATVLVKGTTIGTVTDTDGKFLLRNLPSGGAVLQVSYVGMLTQEVIAKPNMRVVLKSDTKVVDEIVVVAYGTAKKSSFTGSAASIGSKDLEIRPLTNAASVLDGAAPGVQVAAASGQPGDSPSIRIRGFGSVNASNSPLYVVDGSIYNGAIGDINPNDIEAITVLKDAASTSLYGSSAGNGVILITTKKAKEENTAVNLSITQGFSQRAIKEYNRINVMDYYPLQWEQLKNQYMTANSYTAEKAAQTATANIFGLLMYNPFKGVANNEIVGTDGKLNPSANTLLWGDDLDWYDEMERTGYRGEYNLSYTNKTNKSDTYVSVSYLEDNGYVIKSDFERFAGRANVNVYPVKWFKTGLNIAGTRTTSNTANATDNSSGYANPFMFARGIGPIYPVYLHDTTTGEYILDETGAKQYDYSSVRAGSAYSGRHIVAETNWNQRKYTRDGLNARTYLDLNLYDGLTATINATLESTNYRNAGYDNKLVGDGAPAGRLRIESTRSTTYTFNQLLSYAKSFDKHTVDALIGHENYSYEYQYSYAMRQGQVLDGLYEMDNFVTINSVTSYTDTYKKEGYLGRLNYNYDDKYYASFSFRRDGTSRFHKDSRWGNFWSLGASWRMDQESFIKDLKWVDQLKLRASYGETGNDAGIGYYPYQTLYGMGYNNATEAGILFDSFGNNNLKWETQVSYDAAIEFGLFEKLTGTLEFFNKESKDLLFEVPKPISSGTESIWENIGKVSNKGLEVTLDYVLLKNKDWRWNIGLNATFLKNEVKKLPDGQKEIIDGTKKIMVGRSIYDYWLKEYAGVDPNDGAALYRFDDSVKEDGTPAQTWSDTDGRIIGDEKFTTSQAKAKYHYAGSAIPDVYGGINMGVKYKAFELTTVFSYALGGKIYNSSYQSLMSVGAYGAAMHSDIKNRWQKAGDVTNTPRLDGSKSSDFNAQSDRWLISSDFISMKSLSLGYNIPKSIYSNTGIRNARVSISGENLFLINALQGMDTQQSYNGIINNAHIPARSWTFGLNVSF